MPRAFLIKNKKQHFQQPQQHHDQQLQHHDQQLQHHDQQLQHHDQLQSQEELETRMDIDIEVGRSHVSSSELDGGSVLLTPPQSDHSSSSRTYRTPSPPSPASRTCRTPSPPSPATSVMSGRDPSAIYPSPSPSTEDRAGSEDLSVGDDDDEELDDDDEEEDEEDHGPCDLTAGSSGQSSPRRPVSTSPSLSSNPDLPSLSSWGGDCEPRPSRLPSGHLPSPETSPESDGIRDLERRSPKRGLSPATQPRLATRHQEAETASLSMRMKSSDSQFWQNNLPGMGLGGMGAGMGMHHPYLALSFRRLQQIHLRAAQEGVVKFNPFQPHIPLSTLHGQTLTFPGIPVPCLTPVASHGPVSQMSRHTDDFRFLNSNGFTADPEYMKRSPPLTPPNGPAHSPHEPRGASTSPRDRMTSPTMRDDVMPLDLDTKSTAEKRRRRDGDPPRYSCDACGKSYSTFSGLSKHKQFHCASQVQKQFNCKYCDKTYVSLGALKMHIRTHTLPCKCHLCGKAFSRPWLLQGHVRTHTGEKPFQCAHCGRSFADRSNLRAHLQTHSDVKKYSCRTCSKTFSRMSLLLKHEDGGCSGVVH